MTTMHKNQSGDKTYRKHFFFWLPVQKLCSSCLFSGKALDDLLIKVRHVSDEFLLHGEHSQSIKTILCHGVSQESLDPFQKQKSTSWIQLLSGVWWRESWEDWMCLWKCSVGCSWWKKKHWYQAQQHYVLKAALHAECRRTVPWHASGLHHTPIKNTSQD